MKYLYILAICCLKLSCAFAQTDDLNFTLGISMPNTGELTAEQFDKLQNKITQLIDNSHQALAGYYNDFAVYPSISVEETSVVEGGIQNITVTTINLFLTIKQVSTGVNYNTLDKKLKGSGNNKEQAITNAISRINTSDIQYAEFISTAKDKILRYYNNNCNYIIETAANMGAKNNFEQAISLLQSIPGAATCYSEAQKKASQLFDKYERVSCAKNIYKAKSQIALSDYNDAMETLQLIDPASGCAKEAEKLMTQVSAKAAKKEYDMEKLRMNAIKSICKSYFTAQAKSHEGRKKSERTEEADE